MENEKPFKLVSKYRPTGDQPEAIDQLVKGLENGVKEQVLMGVTGSGKSASSSAYSSHSLHVCLPI